MAERERERGKNMKMGQKEEEHDIPCKIMLNLTALWPKQQLRLCNMSDMQGT